MRATCPPTGQSYPPPISAIVDNLAFGCLSDSLFERSFKSSRVTERSETNGLTARNEREISEQLIRRRWRTRHLANQQGNAAGQSTSEPKNAGHEALDGRPDQSWPRSEPQGRRRLRPDPTRRDRIRTPQRNRAEWQSLQGQRRNVRGCRQAGLGPPGDGKAPSGTTPPPDGTEPPMREPQGADRQVGPNCVGLLLRLPFFGQHANFAKQIRQDHASCRQNRSRRFHILQMEFPHER